MHQTSLPTIDEAIAAMTQEEVCLSIEKAYEKVVSASTFVVMERMEWNETRPCFTCGEIGHMKWNCPTRGRGRGYNRGRSSRFAGVIGGYSGNSEVRPLEAKVDTRET
jgi:hypothetical protein